MGSFHEGHLRLMEASRAICASTVVSLFVNPTQFGPTEDFDAYPRNEPRDLAMAESAGVDIVFVPTVEAIYGPEPHTTVNVPCVTERYEGAHRPGHFTGVATVVL